MTVRFVVIACLLLPTVALGGSGDTSSATSAAVKTATVTTRQLSRSVTADGHIAPDKADARALPVGYDTRIGAVRVHEGDRVGKGQTLFTIEPMADTASKFGQAKAALDYARKELARQKRLQKEQLAGNNQVEQAQKALADARARYDAIKSSGKAGPVKAPFAGTVTKLNVSPGAVLTANSTALVLVPEKRVAVLAVQPEDANAVNPGDVVHVADTFDRRHTFTGKVIAVGDSVDPKSLAVPVTVSIPSGRWRVNTAVKAEITVSRKKALAVPRSAVLRDEQGAYVFIVRDGTGHRVNVKTGISEGNWTEVSGSLHSGDKVVTSGNYELQDGMAVRSAQ